MRSGVAGLEEVEGFLRRIVGATVGGSEQGVGGIQEGASAKKNRTGKSNRVTKR